MFIFEYSEIEKLFDFKEPENSSLDYKSEEYKFIKQKDLEIEINDEIRKKQKFELLKDICGLLNGEGGCILLGIKDNKNGFPKGELADSGLDKEKLPSKYTEEIEHVVLTGINPIPQIQVKTIDNEKNNKKTFISINVPRQTHPLFCVIKNENGQEKNDYFIRRGRINGYLSVQEIHEKITTYEQHGKKSMSIFDDLKKLFMSDESKETRLILYSFPKSEEQNFNILKNESIEKMLRGENANQIEKSYKITINELNNFPFPTFEGVRITDRPRSLEVWENGNTLFQTNMNKSDLVSKVFLQGKSKTESEEIFLLNPIAIEDYIKNYFRFLVSFYEHMHFFGEIVTCIALVPTNKLHAFRNISDWENLINLYRFQRKEKIILEPEDINQNYGPRETEKEKLTIIRRINIPNFSTRNLSDLDIFVKTNVLDYLWRAFYYDSFPKRN